MITNLDEQVEVYTDPLEKHMDTCLNNLRFKLHDIDNTISGKENFRFIRLGTHMLHYQKAVEPLKRIMQLFQI